jgi:hypothetical protein
MARESEPTLQAQICEPGKEKDREIVTRSFLEPYADGAGDGLDL